MFKFIKRKREYKTKGRLYIEAKYLKDAGFNIGENIIYKINKKQNKVKVSVVNYENSKTKKVYKTTGRVGEVPVIDIKTKDIKEFFNTHDNIEVTVVKGNIIFKVKEAVKSVSKGKVIAFKKKETIYSVNGLELAKVVNENQVSFFDLFKCDFTETDSIETIIYKLKSKTIKMISLFSGAGMLDLGFKDNGNYDIQFAIDTYEKKRLKRYHLDTYRHNIGNHIIEGDVLDLKEEDIPLSDFVCGGIPCVKFSKLNTKDNFRKSKEEAFPLLEKFINIVKWSTCKGFAIDYLYNSYNINLNDVISIIKIRELARLFSLPDSFIFHGSVTSIVTQIKNGVDYKVSSFLAKIIAKQLLPIL